jgi:diketogulonate reductase-like aldo/keto reductase
MVMFHDEGLSLLDCIPVVVTTGIQVVAYASMGAGQLVESPEVISVATAIKKSPAQVKVHLTRNWPVIKL